MNIESITSTYETHFFSNLMYKNFLKKEFYFREKMLSHSFLAIDSTPPPISLKDIIFKKKIYHSFKNAVDEFTKSNNSTIFLEKTPKHLHYINNIKDCFPDPVFIHVQREPFENIRSLFNASASCPEIWGERNLDNCVNRWIEDRDIHRHYKGKKNHYFVDYNSLCDKPEYFIQHICSSLKLQWNGQISISHAKKVVKSDEIWKENNFKRVGVKSDHSFPLTKKEFFKKYPSCID